MIDAARRRPYSIVLGSDPVRSLEWVQEIARTIPGFSNLGLIVLTNNLDDGVDGYPRGLVFSPLEYDNGP